AQLGSSIHFEATLSGSGAIAQGDNAKAAAATGDKSIAIGRARDVTIIRQPITKPPALDKDAALSRYLSHTIASNRRLQLQGIRSSGELVSIDLEDIYITLSAVERRSVKDEEAWLDEQRRRAPGETMRRPAMSAAYAQQTRVKVQTALTHHPRLVVLGDPGSGKTTLLRYLALTWAREMAGEKGLVKKRLNLAEAEDRLPILLPLRDFAGYLAENHPNAATDGPKLLLNYLRTYFANQDISLPERFFAAPLAAGTCVVLLDGMDEVADLATRIRVSRIIEKFTIAYPKNRYIVTSRVVGYKGSVRLGQDYAVATVRDFNQEDIERFVRYWNLAVEITLAGEDAPVARQAAAKKTKALLSAIKKHERIRELAVNPLLLTVIALVQRYRAILPERRTELYEEAIEVLLGNWDEAKGMNAKTVLADLELDAGDRRSFLEPVALWMMENKRREIERDELGQQLRRAFVALAPDKRRQRKLIDAFLALINERSGLLTERGQGIYSFSHLTFQEHLAARAIADRDDYIDFILAR
ncbi:MAG TPA: NACHT domain-containing protein, partial [Anaerolineae bacterium]|nr:NACHT domain-containing protein [Anaerolineae bacterium]